MRVLQFVFGLGLIVAMLAVETLVLVGLAWMVLSLVRVIPLVGRKHRHDGPGVPATRFVRGAVRWEGPQTSRKNAD